MPEEAATAVAGSGAELTPLVSTLPDHVHSEVT
jgi:hypothetical protein